jgi:hypothetical protein
MDENIIDPPSPQSSPLKGEEAKSPFSPWREKVRMRGISLLNFTLSPNRKTTPWHPCPWEVNIVPP